MTDPLGDQFAAAVRWRFRVSLLSRRRRWQVEIVHPEARAPWVRLVGANGEIVFRTEEFDSLSNARRAGLRAAEELRLNLREVKE